MARNDGLPKVKKGGEYDQFLKKFQLENSVANAQAFLHRKKAQRVAKRSIVEIPGGENLNRFDTGENEQDFSSLRKGRREDTVYTPNESYISIKYRNGKIVKAPFWCESISFGYGSSGETVTAATYQAYYAKSFNEDSLTIKGRVPSEGYLADFGEWIRGAHISIMNGIDLMRLVIPAANIDMRGFIPTWKNEFSTDMDPAPQFEFEFVIQQRNSTDKTMSEYSNLVVAYFLYPNDYYWGKESRAFTDRLYNDLQSEMTKIISQELIEQRKLESQQVAAAKAKAKKRAAKLAAKKDKKK